MSLEIIQYAYIALIGLCMGSFLNVLADRLSQQVSIRGRSKCDHCGRTLSWKDLVPVGSFLISLGRCRTCRAKLSWQYPLSELLTAFSYMAAWYFAPFPGVANHILTLILVSILIVILLADLRYQIIPDEMQIGGFLLSVAFLVTGHMGTFSHMVGLVFDGALGMLPILLIYVGTRGRGMGFGDVKWAFVMGCLLGVPNVFIALYSAFVLGGVVGVGLLLSRRAGMKQKIAFGPFLLFGTVLVFFGQHTYIPEALRLVGLG